MKSLSLACLVLLTACVSCQDPSGTEEIDENGPSITIWKGKCRKGKTVLCRVKCTVELVSGTAHKKDIAWFKKISGGIDTIVPNGKLRDGVYTSIIPGPDPLGDYYCRYTDPISSAAFDSETDITISKPEPPPVIVIADVRSVTCVELSDCEISCSAAALNFKTKDETKLKFDKADSKGDYQLIAKQGILDKKRAILRWQKDDGGVNIGDSGFYKCEYDGSRSSAAITLSVTPVCYKPANPPNGHLKFKRKPKETINIGETYLVKCDKNALMTGNNQMTCSGTDNFPGELSPAPTCTPIIRSVSAYNNPVVCMAGSYCEISCTIEGIAEKTNKKGELYTPTKKARWSWLKKATTFDSIRWHGRSALDNKVMTYKFKSVSLGDIGEYKCAYDFGKLKPDVRESGVINLIVN